MNLYLVNNKQEKTPTKHKGAYYCSHIIARAETEALAKELFNEPWFTAEQPVMIDDEARGKINKVVQIVLKPMED